MILHISEKGIEQIIVKLVFNWIHYDSESKVEARYMQNKRY